MAGHNDRNRCSPIPVKDWHQRLGGDVTADAIMDRIIHNGITIDTGEYTMRRHHANTTRAKPITNNTQPDVAVMWPWDATLN
ncbi:ATP-binding protein [Bifidobacterium jacchi]|uniref:ATP-binding protein n=1 Tax=Bifidobacterium jacchi TaxID=2490545 RepID=UPI00240DC09C|nr:ATP-binding protein [Bifidobacterium jacchi]